MFLMKNMINSKTGTKIKLTRKQIEKLKALMVNSARKGNLANSGVVFENNKPIAWAESWVVSKTDATAHSERMLVERVCKKKKTNWTQGLTMISVVEPCLMCLSACSQAGYAEIAYIIPGKKYVDKIPWTTDTLINKKKVASKMSSKIKYTHLKDLEKEFSLVFENEMSPKFIK